MLPDPDRFYHYYFEGMEDPILILAPNKKAAREILDKAPLPTEYLDKKILEEKTSQPLIGVSTMKIKGKTYVWQGKKDGWKEQPAQ